MTRPTIDIIHREHRSMGKVINALLWLVKQARDGAEPDFALLAGVLQYVEDFPQTFHHPKEDDHLFARLRERNPQARKLIGRLEEEHRVDQALLGEMKRRLQDWFESGHPDSSAFAALACEYAVFYRRHMALEEAELLPLAEHSLTDQDWAAIDRVFLAHDDPMFGAAPRQDFEDLLEFIREGVPACDGTEIPGCGP